MEWIDYLRADRPPFTVAPWTQWSQGVPGPQTGSARSLGSVAIKLSGWLIILLLNFTKWNLGLNHTWASWASHQTWTNFQPACLLNRVHSKPLLPEYGCLKGGKRREQEREMEWGKKKDKNYVSSHMWNVRVRVHAIWEQKGGEETSGKDLETVGRGGKTSRSKGRCLCVWKCHGETVTVYVN